MNDKSSFFKFMGDLKPWVKQEPKRCNAKDLSTVMFVVETLVEYKGTSIGKSDSRPRDNITSGGDLKKFYYLSGNKPPIAPAKVKIESSKGEHKKGSTFKCFLCYGVHMARDYPT